MLDFLNGLASITAVVLYVVQTYSEDPSLPHDEQPSIVYTFDNIQDGIVMFFFVDWLLHLYAAENRTQHLTNSYVIVDVVTVIPPLLLMILEAIFQQT